MPDQTTEKDIPKDLTFLNQSLVYDVFGYLGWVLSGAIFLVIIIFRYWAPFIKFNPLMFSQLHSISTGLSIFPSVVFISFVVIVLTFLFLTGLVISAIVRFFLNTSSNFVSWVCNWLDNLNIPFVRRISSFISKGFLLKHVLNQKNGLLPAEFIYQYYSLLKKCFKVTSYDSMYELSLTFADVHKLKRNPVGDLLGYLYDGLLFNSFICLFFSIESRNFGYGVLSALFIIIFFEHMKKRITSNNSSVVKSVYLELIEKYGNPSS